MCPHCGQNAPIVYRGVAAFCSACSRPRPPLIAPSVSFAGKPSQVGGTVAGTFGWLVLAFGLATSLGLGFLLGGLYLPLGLAVGVPIGVITLAVSLSLLLSGRSLRKKGLAREKEMRRRAVFALAMNRGGTVTAQDVAASLDLPPADADAYLTDLAKTQPDEVTLEIDDKGGIYFTFPRLLAGGARPSPAGRSRIADPHVRVTGVPDHFEADGLDYEEPVEPRARRHP